MMNGQTNGLGIMPFPGMVDVSGLSPSAPSAADQATDDLNNYLRAVQLNDSLLAADAFQRGGPAASALPHPYGRPPGNPASAPPQGGGSLMSMMAGLDSQSFLNGFPASVQDSGFGPLDPHSPAKALQPAARMNGPGPLDLQTGPISAAQAQQIDPAFHYQLQQAGMVPGPTSPPLPIGYGQPDTLHGTSPSNGVHTPSGPMPPLPPGAPPHLLQSPEYQAAYRAALNVALSQQQQQHASPSSTIPQPRYTGGAGAPGTYPGVGQSPGSPGIIGSGGSFGGPPAPNVNGMAYSPETLAAALAMQSNGNRPYSPSMLGGGAGGYSNGRQGGHGHRHGPSQHQHQPSNLGLPQNPNLAAHLGAMNGLNSSLNAAAAAAAYNNLNLNAAALGLIRDPTDPLNLNRQGLMRGSPMGSAVNLGLGGLGGVPRTDSFGSVGLGSGAFKRDSRSASHSHLSSGLRSGPGSSSNLLALQTDPSDILPRGLPSVGSFSALSDLVNYKYQHLEEVVGQVKETAQDQNGCRFLQKKLDEGGAEAVSRVLEEVLEAANELMVDPFANYMIQKLLDICNEEQRLQLIRRVEDKLVSIALNTHGTRAVQKLVETVKEPDQIELIARALAPGSLLLIKDLNGNHVIQKILQKLKPEEKQFVYDAVCNNIMEVASHSRHGCCVLQRCLDFASPQQRERLVDVIANSALELAQDPFGNYVTQYALGMGDPTISSKILNRLKGNVVELSLQKFSSNVIEKFLKPSDGVLVEHRESIIREIIQSPLLARLLNDSYGNYVMQSALTVTADTPVLHGELVDALRPYLPLLRGCLHGRRIISKMNLKF